MQGVLDAGFLFLHLGLGGGAYIDDGHTAGELGEALLELLAVVIAGGFLDLTTDLVDPALDGLGLAAAVDDDGVFLLHDDVGRGAEVGKLNAVQLQAEVFGDEFTTGEDGNVFHHGLAAVAEARCFHGTDLQGATDAVHHESSERFALDVFGHEQQRLVAGGHDLLEDGLDVLEGADLLLVEQHVGVLEFALLGVGVGHEVRGEVSLVELHAFDDLEGGLDGAGFFHGDGAVLADLVHGVGDDFTDAGFPVGGHGGHLLDLVLTGHLLGDLGELCHGGVHSFLHTTLDVNGAGTGGHAAETFAVDGLGKHGRGGGTVTGHVAGLAGGFANHLGTHVFVRALELDLFGHSHTVLGGGGGAEFLVDEDVTTFGA